MSDPVYAKLIFNEFHVEYTNDPYDTEGFEVFTARELYHNGFENVPTVEEFVASAEGNWGVDIKEVKDKYDNVLYPTQ